MKQIFTLIAGAAMLCIQTNAQPVFIANVHANATDYLASYNTQVTASPIVTPFASNNQFTTKPVFAAPSLGFANNAFQFKLLSFKATKSVQNNALLEWNMDDNQMLNHIEIERSINGKAFKTIAVVLISEKEGHEKYKFKEKADNNKTYYRLKIFNTKGNGGYSNVISFD